MLLFCVREVVLLDVARGRVCVYVGIYHRVPISVYGLIINYAIVTDRRGRFPFAKAGLDWPPHLRVSTRLKWVT